MQKDVRVAAVTMHCPLWQTDLILEKVEGYAREAASQNADVLVFPEMALTGYSASEPLPAALARDAPEYRALSEIARYKKMTLLVGLAEADPKGRKYATQLVCLPDGRIFSHRKTHLSTVEEAWLTPGSDIAVFSDRSFSFGIQLCYEAHFPELATNMALAGAHALFVPHASPRGTSREKEDSWLRHLTARAFDNGLYVVAVNQSGENQAGLSFPGLALVLDPLGRVEARFHGDEGLLIADLRADLLNQVRNHRMTSFLSRRKPALYSRKVIKQNF
ncbi:MAG: nitrilase family protein [Desulfatibacillum sp.]|nr:nitrilase family protein [Desulfatibacillum sp.]